MAGQGYKTFTAGEVLTAADLQGYAVDQSIMVFAGTAARAAALGTLVSEGMFTYTTDTNSFQFWNGSAWQDAGGGGGDFASQFLLMGA